MGKMGGSSPELNDVESGTNVDSKLLSAREAERADERRRAEEHRRWGSGAYTCIGLGELCLHAHSCLPVPA